MYKENWGSRSTHTWNTIFKQVAIFQQFFQQFDYWTKSLYYYEVTHNASELEFYLTHNFVADFYKKDSFHSLPQMKIKCFQNVYSSIKFRNFSYTCIHTKTLCIYNSTAVENSKLNKKLIAARCMPHCVLSCQRMSWSTLVNRWNSNAKSNGESCRSTKAYTQTHKHTYSYIATNI